jgi:hypothetical protein
LQIDTTANFLNPFINLLTNDTFYIPTANLPFGKIHWRINAEIAGSVFSAVDVFWIVAATKAPFGITQLTEKTAFGCSLRAGRGIEITYNIEKSSRVSLSIFSMTGQCVASIIDERCAPGTYRSEWGGKDTRTKLSPRGAYIVVFQLEGKTATQKIILVR